MTWKRHTQIIIQQVFDFKWNSLNSKKLITNNVIKYLPSIFCIKKSGASARLMLFCSFSFFHLNVYFLIPINSVRIDWLVYIYARILNVFINCFKLRWACVRVCVCECKCALSSFQNANRGYYCYYKFPLWKMCY